MSYNGIGLSTARGSGTNGYVQKNIGNKESLGQYERRKHQQLEKERQYAKTSKQTKLKKDSDIVEHDYKRQIEIKCSVLRDKLEEDDSLSDEDIEAQVKKLREELVSREESKRRITERNKLYRAERSQRSNHVGRDRSPARDSEDSKSEAQNFIDSFKVNDIDY